MPFFDVAGDRLNKKDHRQATEEESEADVFLFLAQAAAMHA
jgi:hypothetical protein